MNEADPSPRLVEQRTRNRLIEWLEVLVSYQSDPPGFDLNELLNQWEDWSPDSYVHPPAVYTQSEAEQLSLVANNWEAFCQATPKSISSEPGEFMKPEWAALVACAQAALAELMRRGRLSDEVEVGGNSAT